MYIRRFRYSSENVQCKYCTEYRGKKNRCQLTRCPWIAERVEAGEVTYKEAVRSIVPQFCVYRVRAERLIREYEGSLWLSSKHQNCMQWFNHQLGYKRKDFLNGKNQIHIFRSDPCRNQCGLLGNHLGDFANEGISTDAFECVSHV